MKKFTAAVIAVIFGALFIFPVHSVRAGDEGKTVFADQKCSMCHRIEGKGGKMGPDLSAVGDRRERDWIANFLKDPKGTKEDSKHKTVKIGDEDFNRLVDYLASLKKNS